MAKMTSAELKGLVDKQFNLQRHMLSLYQTLADHFYPERADFTQVRNQGSEIADLLVDSYPVLMRRDLANSFSAMLRDGHWFDVSVDGNPDREGSMWLQWATMRLKKIMDARSAGFRRATKEGDHDYTTFGQTVISTELNKQANGLLFRAWHLRDCAWWEDETGQVSGVVRKWATDLRQAVNYFGMENVHPHVSERVGKEPFKELNVYHIVMPTNIYGDEQLERSHPFVSIYFDFENDHIMEEVGINNRMYTVPRFQTIAGSAYAYSPATMVALPDARTLQAMTHTLLEAGERYARPPIIATTDVVRGDVDLSPDGITWVDREYDEKMGAGLRPMAQDRGGFPLGLEMRDNVIQVLNSAFYLNKITLPGLDKQMTAYETAERMKQYRRENLPLFAPMESEYNGQLCEIAFDVAFQAGLLGSAYDIPQSLSGSDVQFQFTSPLSHTEEEEKANRFAQVSEMLARAAPIDPNVAVNMDVDVAFRDAVIGIGAPASWLRPQEAVEQTRKAQAAKDLMATAMEASQAMPAEEAVPVE